MQLEIPDRDVAMVIQALHNARDKVMRYAAIVGATNNVVERINPLIAKLEQFQANPLPLTIILEHVETIGKV